jgi:hypothetical protein
MTKEPIQPQDKYVLRLPDGMRDRIKAAAEKNNRSMNAEIIARFSDVDELQEQIKALQRELDLGRDPDVASKTFQVALRALEESGILLRHKDVYTREAEEWRFIRPFVVAGDSEIIAALSNADLEGALALAKAKTPAGQEPPEFTDLQKQEMPE